MYVTCTREGLREQQRWADEERFPGEGGRGEGKRAEELDEYR